MARRKRPPKELSGHTQQNLSAASDSFVGTKPIEQSPQQAVAATAATFSGPLPPPNLFRQYGEIIPDAPERILRVFEDDSRHTREIQFAALQAQQVDNRRVHWMAWSLIVAGFVLSGVFAYLNKDWLAGITLGTTLTGTISGFVKGRSGGQRDPHSR